MYKFWTGNENVTLTEVTTQTMRFPPQKTSPRPSWMRKTKTTVRN